MRILFVLLVILLSSHLVNADECSWQNDTPCITITKGHLGNSNQLGDKISPTISMPETHLLDVNVSKNFHGVDLGLSITNVFNENYQSPHGFSQNDRKINFIFKRKF